MKERLTKKDKYGHWYTNSTVYDRGMTSKDGVHYEKHYFENGISAYDGEPMDRLAELEDKIENGTLVELPVPSGTELHFLHSHEHADRPISPTIHSTNEWSFEIWGNGKSGISSDDIPCGYYGVYRHKLGDTVFLTRAEAEARLKELKHDNPDLIDKELLGD